MGGRAVPIVQSLHGARFSGRKTQALVLVGGLFLIGLLWLGLLYHLAQRRETVVDQAQRDVLNLSVAIAAQVSRLIEGTDQTMRLIQSAHDSDPDTFDFSAWMQRTTSLDEVAVQVTIFGENGGLVASRSPPKPGAPPVSNADRPYFRYLADHPDAGLYVGRTIQGRILGVPAFQLVRRLSRPDGSFAGVLIVSLSPDHLAEHFKALDIGKGGSIALFGRDGYVRARWPFVEGMYDKDATTLLSGNGLFGQLEHAPFGTYRVQSAFDGTERIFGYRSLDERPLVVSVGKSVDEIMAGFGVEERRAVAVGTVLTLILMMGLLSLLRELDRRRTREAQLVDAHQAVAASDARFRLIADHTTDMIVQLDRSGRRRFVSPASLELLGFTPEELVGSRPADSVHPDDVAGFHRAIKALIRGETSTAVSTHRVRHRDGRWIWIEASWQVVRGDGGRTSGFVASLRSAMARHAAETALRESEERYRTLTDTLPQLVWVARAGDGQTVYVNRRYESYCGPIASSLEARRNLVHPADVVALQASWDAALPAGDVCEGEARLRRHDGAFRWHKIVMIPTRQGGALSGWVGTALDIDDIVAARKALEETSDLLRLAQDAAGAGSWDFDLRAQTVAFSHESARMHGLPGTGPAYLPFAAWRELVRPEDIEATETRVAESVAANTIMETEFRVTHLDGSVRWLHGIGRTYYNASGDAVRMIGLNFDITQRKDAELALRHAKDAAEAARTEAERASVAKTDFLASMSHEIRTPLNAMIGFTDLLAASDRLAPDLRRQAELARSSGAALLTIVDDILDFSKVEAGRIELDRQPFASAALIDNCVSIVRGTATAKSIELRSQIDATLPRALVGDASRIRQVLLNLLNNAVKFTRTGSVNLSVQHERSAARGEQIRFAITDTGIGIATDKQHRLFERFSQIDGSIRRDFGGTGLGLAICKRLVELMGGEIGVVSQEGIGSTFWFCLTLPRGTLPAPLAAVTDAPASRKCGRLLLVEDVEINQELARAVLEVVGHRVDIVGDGAAAVTTVQTGLYDLVLMDVQMPGMDGMTATRLIRSLDHPASTLPIIAMTANVLPDEVIQFRRAGMNDHVGKPFNRADLYAIIDRWLPGAAQSGPSGSVPPNTADEVDASVFDELLELHKPSGVIRLLGFLDDEMSRSFLGSPDDAAGRATLRREAHVLASAAGMLGFARLSAACAQLEGCGEDGSVQAFADRLGRLKALVAVSIDEARRLAASLHDDGQAGLVAVSG